MERRRVIGATTAATAATTAMATLLALAAGCDGAVPGGRVARPVYQGGVETGEPWVVAVHYLRPGTTKLRLCTGSVIAPRVVVTAKHCVHDEVTEGTWTPMAASDMTVSVGHSMVDEGGILRDVAVAGIRTTPGIYRQADALAGDDVALLLLDGDIGVEPVPVAADAPAVGDGVLIAGFGWTEADVLGVKHAGSAAVSLLSEGTFETDGPAWTCTGDSGGPALHAGRRDLLGVTSIGPRGCTTARSIYTRLDRHAAMVAEALGTDPPDGDGADVPADPGSPGDVGSGDDLVDPADAWTDDPAVADAAVDAGRDAGPDPLPDDRPGAPGGGGCGQGPVGTSATTPLLALFVLLLLLRRPLRPGA